MFLLMSNSKIFKIYYKKLFDFVCVKLNSFIEELSAYTDPFFISYFNQLKIISYQNKIIN